MMQNQLFSVAITALTLFGLVVSLEVTQFPAQADQLQQERSTNRELIAVAAAAVRDQKYSLALRVSQSVINLYPSYGTGHLYKAIALYRLDRKAEALSSFLTAKKLYLSKLESSTSSSKERKEAEAGLNVVATHLQLLVK